MKQPFNKARRGFMAAVALALPLALGLGASGSHQAQAAGLAVDVQVTAHQSAYTNSVTATGLTTTQPNDLLVAFVAADGSSKSGGQSIKSVTGANLTWKLAKRTNTQAGTSEIWYTVAASKVSNASVKATYSGSYNSSLNVVAFSGAKTVIGATAGANASTGAPSVSLTTTQAGSWVWAVGNDWDKPIARVVGPNQTKVDEYFPPAGDTYWLQRQDTPTAAAAGTKVTINDTAPTSDRWNLTAIEIIPAVSDLVAPSAPANLTANAVSPAQVDLAWDASTDNLGIAGYKVFRDGTQIATASGTTYSDTTAAASTTYTYTVKALDVSGNTSAESEAAQATTPADTTAPVISNVGITSMSSSKATVIWTTDEKSDSLVEYGLDATYGSSTTVDSTLATSHSQTLSGLSPDTTYYYRVTSTDAYGNQSVSTDNSFTTPSVETRNAAPGIAKGVIEDFNSYMNQDAIDIQNAGITWMRGWLECGEGAQNAAYVQMLQSKGITFLPTWNCPLSYDVAQTQAKLKADMQALMPYGVHTWEIGNEMNGGWNSEDNYCNNNSTPGNMACAEKAYLEYQKAAYQTIHDNDPQGVMIYGGLSNWSVNLGPWLTAMEQDQAWQWMDGMGFHPYGGTINNSIGAMNSLKSYMEKHPEWAAKPIWITEVGCWSSGLSNSQQSPCSPQTEAGKSAYLTGLMDALKNWNKGTQFEIRTPIAWYILHESGNTAGYGLVQLTTPRTYLPAYTAYKNYAF